MGPGLLDVCARGHHNESVLDVSAPSRRRRCPNLWGIYEQASQLPTDVYDYIVVGGSFPMPYNQPKERAHPRLLLGGTAGNVVANRLTEDTNIQVLVLEAGGR